MNNLPIILEAQAHIATHSGQWLMKAYTHPGVPYAPHLVLAHEGHSRSEEPVLVRIHSECITGDLFGSWRCDCGEQLEQSMKMIAEQGGFIIYLRQEGRGIGLIEKLKAYNLQDQGADTIQANQLLGHGADERTYEIAITILKEMDINEIRLLTNNPEKIEAIERSSIVVSERVPLVIPPRNENRGYMQTKKDLMGHIFSRE